VVSNYASRPSAQFDDETVNLVATRDGVQGQVLNTKNRSIPYWVRAKAPTGPLRVNRGMGRSVRLRLRRSRCACLRRTPFPSLRRAI
jgi:hypothetical protein